MSPKDSITSPERQDDDTLEASLRPKRLADFVGQQQARENLSIFIDAAKARAEALDHRPRGPGRRRLSRRRRGRRPLLQKSSFS